MVSFEKRRLHDIKTSMLDYFKIQLVFHAKAIEFYSKCFESMSMVDEERDLQEFQRKLSMARGVPDTEEISQALTSMTTTTNGYSDTLGSSDPYTSTYESTASDHRRSTMYGDDEDDDEDDDYYDDDEYDLSTAR